MTVREDVSPQAYHLHLAPDSHEIPSPLICCVLGTTRDQRYATLVATTGGRVSVVTARPSADGHSPPTAVQSAPGLSQPTAAASASASRKTREVRT